MKLLHSKGSLEIGPLPILMGILNVTPDSFSDGGNYSTAATAQARALDMLDEGAAIIDIGGESTRPGAKPIGETEECERVLPVIELLTKERPDIIISIDTSKATVAREAIRCGAAIINDVSGGLWDPEMFPVVHHTQAGYICTHALDRPDRMQDHPEYQNVIVDVQNFLLQQKSRLLELGVDEECLAFDVGIGFGKNLTHNLDLIRAGTKDLFAELKRPMLWGLSRKSFIEKHLQRQVKDRLPGGLAAHAALLQCSSPQIWRVHDVQATADFLSIHAALS